MRSTIVRLILGALTVFTFVHAATADFVQTWP